MVYLVVPQEEDGFLQRLAPGQAFEASSLPQACLLKCSHAVNTLPSLCCWDWAQWVGSVLDNDNAFRYPDRGLPLISMA